jgi:alpha-tubulin suppressor-like RCC1 family protein
VGVIGVNIEIVIKPMISAGHTHSLALDSNGKLWAIGDNEYGQLGLGYSGNEIEQTSFQPVTSGSISSAKIVSVVAGMGYSLVLDSNGTVWAAGSSNNDGLFRPVAISGLSPAKIVSIAAGFQHSFVLDSNGKLWATGRNSNGQLGLGDRIYQNTFQPVMIANLTSSAKIVSMAAGVAHSLALDSNGNLWATGSNSLGQSGSGNETEQNSFKPITISGLAPAKIVSIAAGSSHSLALDSYGRVWATGANDHTGSFSGGFAGQLGLGDYVNRNSFQLVTSGLISNANIVSISAGNGHSLALDSDGRVWATGYNAVGELGSGDTNTKNSFRRVDIPSSLPNVNIVSIAAGMGYSLVLDSNGTAWEVGLLYFDNNATTFEPISSPWL